MSSQSLQTLLNGFKKSGLVNRILITGGCGAFGTDLYPRLKQVYGEENILVTDVQNTGRVNDRFYRNLDVSNKNAIEEITTHFKPDTIIHLASLTPTKCEEDSAAAIRVNAEGSRNVIEIGTEHTLRVFAANTIATYGALSQRRNVPDLAVQRPETMHGITKFYAELLGNYHRSRHGTDFRAIRYPVIVSPTLIQGKINTGVVEMYHAAHKKEAYKSFLKADRLLPTIYIDDAIYALLQLLEAPKEKLKENTYNISGCSFTPQSQLQAIRKYVPKFKAKFVKDERNGFFDAWPETVNDSLARDHWGFEPQYDLDLMTKTILEELATQTSTGAEN